MKGINMTADDVRAILDERKTKTRCVIKPQPTEGANGSLGIIRKKEYWEYSQSWKPDEAVALYAPYKPGDILYVKERARKFSGIQYIWSGGTYIPGFDFAGWNYSADDTHVRNDEGFWGEMFLPDGDTRVDIDYEKWCASISMPLVAARIFLRVTNMRAERLQKITPADVVYEGLYEDCRDCLDSYGNSGSQCCYKTDDECSQADSVIGVYETTWNSTNGTRKDGIYAWERDPWVWVVTFKMISKEEAEKENVA